MQHAVAFSQAAPSKKPPRARRKALPRGAVLLCGAALLAAGGLAIFNLPRLKALISTTVIPLPAAHPLEPVLAGGPLRVDPDNPRYFTNTAGQPILLAGSHTWLNLVDFDTRSPLQFRFPYARYLSALSAHQHNFFRLWAWEEARTETNGALTYYHAPLIYQRSGPGEALDGGLKFDLTRFNQAYFDRLRSRVVAAGQRGIYVSVMLFNGWSVENKDNNHDPWPAHPFNAANNINLIDGDLNGDGNGAEVHTLANPAVTAYQLAYVHKVIDTLNDLDNVLYEISNESGPGSLEWQYEMIREIKRYEAAKPKQHPVGMTAIYPGGSNQDLFNSPADWISVNGDVNNPILGDGKKVILNDTDHLCGTCGDRRFAWKSLTRGLNPILMDPFGWEGEQTGFSVTEGVWEDIRRNLGYAVQFSERLDLNAARPRGDLSSSGYALADLRVETAAYLVYIESGRQVTVDLKDAVGELRVEWLNPANGELRQGPSVAGGAKHTFPLPYSGDAVLFIYHVQTAHPTDHPLLNP